MEEKLTKLLNTLNERKESIEEGLTENNLIGGYSASYSYEEYLRAKLDEINFVLKIIAILWEEK